MQEELEPIFTSIYTVEMCTKILAMGFIMHPDSYLRYSWRQNKTAHTRSSKYGLLSVQCTWKDIRRLRHGLPEKNSSSFRFCPNEGGGGPCPNFLSTFHKLYIRVDRHSRTCKKKNNTTHFCSLRGSQERLQQFFCSITLPFFATDTYTKVAQGPTLVYTVYCIPLSQKIEFFLCLIYFRIWVWILAGPEIRAQRAPMPPSKSLNRIIS